MKELSIEEKAKAYDEALERAKKYLGDCMLTRQEYVEKVFPELKTSDDERIRKEIISALKNANYKGVYDKHIVWLGKQGEQKPIWHNEDEEPQIGRLILLIMQSGTAIVAKIIEPNHTFNHGERWAYIDDLLEKQDTIKDGNSIDPHFGKPIITDCGAKEKIQEKIIELSHKEDQGWSEEDEIILNGIIDDFGDGKTSNMLQESWLKSIKERIQPQPKQDGKWKWEEDDEKFCKENILIELGNIDGVSPELYSKIIDWISLIKKRLS